MLDLLASFFVVVRILVATGLIKDRTDSLGVALSNG